MLEEGDDGIGSPDQGHWRLEVSASADVQVLAYVEDYAGFVSAVHDIAPHTENEHYVYRFTPASAWPLESQLRLINLNDSEVNVTIAGIDSAGNEAKDGDLTLAIDPYATATLTGRILEATIGEGVGTWRLTVTADAPISVMHLYQTPSGTISNLSTIPQQTSASTAMPTDPPTTPPAETKPAAPTIEVTGPREFIVSFDHEAKANTSYAFEVEVRAGTSGSWDRLKCDVLTWEDAISDEVSVTVTTTRDIPDRQVLQARHRSKESTSCTAGTWGLWSEIGETTYREDDGGTTPSDKRYSVGDVITTMPRGFPAGTASGSTVVLRNGITTITFQNGGYFQNADYRWTCDAAGGCRVVNRVVDLGTIVETELDP